MSSSRLLANCQVGCVGTPRCGSTAQSQDSQDSPSLLRTRLSPSPPMLPPAACPSDEARTAYFLQLWTLKEAYVKALGRGISAPPGLRSFGFRVQANGHSQNGGSPGGSFPASSSSGGSSLDGDSPDACCASGQQQAGQAQQAQQAAAWVGQEQRQPNVPQHLVVQAPLLWYSLSSGGGNGNGNGSSVGSAGGSIGSMSSLVSASLDFLPSSQESRRWQFALLQPAPGLVSALCVERRLLAAGHCGQQEQEGVRLLSFEAAGPWGGQEQPLETAVLAVGQYDPA